MTDSRPIPADPIPGMVAIVTGAASGIGRATCLALSARGADLIAVDLDRERVQATLTDLAGSGAGRVPLGLVLDVRRESDAHELARRTLEAFGRIDCLIACAGILRPKGSRPKPLVELATEEWDAVVDTNLKGTFLSNRAVLPSMIARRRGQIINVSSTSGRQGRAFDSAYCASKFGVVGLSEALAEEVRPYRIRVHVLLPDAVDTPLWEQNGPIPRPVDALPPSRVADLIVYLLALPEDTILSNLVIAPFRSRHRTAQPRSTPEEAEEPRTS
jgi:NAD(P)-dependent dehydrogenase (short-subunit alcohol dehydrogenase family)